MLRVTRWALLALLALIISVIPFGVSWADPGRSSGRDDSRSHGREKEDDDRKGQGQRAKEHTASREAEQEETSDQEDSPSGGRWGREPSPRPSSASRDPHGGRPEAPADVIDASFSASPASIDVGETSTLRATVSNPGSEAVAAVEVLVELPSQLEVVSTDPQSPPSHVLELPLGDLAPGAAATATVVVVGVDIPGDVQPVRFAITADDQTFHHELLVTVEQEATETLALVQSSPLLIQVGDTSSFSATLSNNSSAAVEDVAVTTMIAPELDVVGVEPIAAADAIQLGASPKGEDIVWIFDSLTPGQEVHMRWTAEAVAPGDLEAANEVQATVEGAVAASSQQATYLGFVKGVRTDRSAAAPVVRERVVTRLIPVSTEVAGSVGGGILPVTGWSPGILGFGGALLIGLGAVLLWASRGLPSRRLAFVLVGALLLTTTACVSDRTEPQAEGPSPVESPSAQEAPDDKQQEDQVLGLRIQRPDRKDTEPQVPAPSDPADPIGASEPVTEIVYEEVSEVVSVVVPVAQLPVDTLRSRGGDNTFSFSWNPGAGDLQATSSRIIAADASEEVLAGVASAADRLTATVSVTNLAEERRLHVEGRLVLNIVSADGRTSSLVSEPVDVILDPGASTLADIAFSLPTGSYTAKGAFVPD